MLKYLIISDVKTNKLEYICVCVCANINSESDTQMINWNLMIVIMFIKKDTHSNSKVKDKRQ